MSDSICARCNRTMTPDRASCLYCGWSSDPVLAEAVGGPSKPGRALDEPERFRCAGSTAPFLGWALLTGAAVVLVLSYGRQCGLPPAWNIPAAVALLLFGPVAFALHLIRITVVRVVVIPARGLLIEGREVPWSEIRDVDERGFRFQPDFGLIHSIVRFMSVGPVLGVGPVAWMAYFAFAVVLGLLALALALILGVLFPILVLFSPWQARVEVRLKDGSRLAVRSLSEPDRFITVVRRHLAIE